MEEIVRLPLHMQDALLVALLHETLEDMSSPTTHGTLDTGPLLPYQLFSVALYHRYALRALVQTKLPAKPIKVSNVPIPGQQDPTQESREVQEGILSVLERGGEVSVRILEQLLGAGEVRAPVLATFTVHTHQSSVISHNWDRCKSVADEQFKCQDLVKVLSDDNVAFEIPSYLRKNLELELEAKPEKAPQGLLLQVQTLNTIRNVLEGELWNSSYPISLSQAGKPGVQFLIQALVAKFSKLNSTHKERIRMFLLTVNLASNIREVLVPAIKVCPPLKALISQQELLTMWPQYEESRVSLIKKSPEASMTDPNNLNDIIWDLIHSYNPEWEMPIPIYNTLMKLPQTPQRELVFLYIAKAVELTQAKVYSVMSELTNEARQCLSAHSGRDGIAPWTGVNNCLLGGVSLPSHLYLLALVKPLAATAHALREKHTNKGVWYDLWDVVVGILVNSMQHKRSSSGQSTPIERHHDSVVMSRSAFLDFLENIREPSCLSIIISLLGHVLNILTQEPNSEVHIDHLAMWPLLTSTALCTSWHLSKADLAYMSDQYYSALAGYLTAVFVATDFLRNDTGVDQSVLNDSIIRRMVRCCMNLNCYTQAAILCQFLESIDYSTALRCLQERNSVDAMDAYYSCLWDVSLIEFIINMHQKRGEIQRRDKALTMMGLLEVNSNNNDEIQREAAKVRKHRFLRAMAKQYLC
ncbi:Integrator complex subunit 8-like [Homarus americanus]|uniref:Integrator complex subunit 8-like n=1 Tax=Homarus americanus TaxID=6706 RepID=A0A8J5JGZ4_HOMAM|nr:Integrator complex subunit 8-like [Homarus americanus]